MEKSAQIRLGDAATYINGFAFKPSEWEENGTPIIRIQNLNNENAPFNFCSKDLPNKYIVQKGDTLISWSASLGVYLWEREVSYLNQHIFKVIFDKATINQSFFRYAVSSKLKEMVKNTHGATMKHIVKNDFENTIIPYPTLSLQNKIVAELDIISGTIRKQKLQISNLETLSQALFFDMFGNPLSNSKDFPVQSIDSVIYPKKDIKRAVATFSKEEEISYIDISSIDNKTNNIKSVNSLIFSEAPSRAQQVVKQGDLLVSMVRPNLKNIALIKNIEDNKLVASSGFCVLRPKNVNIEYLRHIVCSKQFTDYLTKQTTGATYPAVNENIIKQIIIPIPSLSLQNEFASKIEAIEKQKSLILQSIKETEELFNSRMDYYFN